MKYKIWCCQRECYSHNEHIFDSLDEIRDILIDYHSVDEDLNGVPLSNILEYYEWEIHNAKTEEFIFIKIQV